MIYFGETTLFMLKSEFSPKAPFLETSYYIEEGFTLLCKSC